MKFIPGLFAQMAFFIMPTSFWGWVGLVLLVLGLFWVVRLTFENPLNILRRRWWLFLVLVIAVPLTSTLLGFRLPIAVRPMPGVPVDSGSPALMILAALPWVLAAGFLGPLPAFLLGGLSGLILGVFETHNPFTIIELAGLALVFSVGVRQRYRSAFFGFLRHPIGAAAVLSVAYAPVYVITALFAVNGSLAVRLDYALTQTWPVMLAQGIEMVLASLAAEAIYLAKVEDWGGKDELRPSPTEVSLQTRFFFGTVPLVLVLFFTLTIGDWLVAGNVARRMVEERMSSAARIAADSLPYFIETGQSLILTMATPDLISLPKNQAGAILAQRLRSVPFFRQLSLLDATGGTLIAGYPETSYEHLGLTPEELAGVKLAMQGVAVQTYSVPPRTGETDAQISFMAVVLTTDGSVGGVLLGRTGLSSNPFTLPAIRAFEGIQNIHESIHGEGVILDDYRRILYPVSGQGLAVYTGKLPAAAGAFEDISPAGTLRYSYYQPATGRPWSIVMSVPAELTQQMALEIAIPLLVILIVISIAAFVLLRVGLTSITSAVRLLSDQAVNIAVGDLDRPVHVHGADEVARLADAFEQMRLSLKARLDDLNRLLVVSQGVAANLDIHDSVKPILTAALLEGASMARVVLIQDVTLEPGQDAPISFGTGPSADLFAYFDSQVFELMRQQDILTVPNVIRMRRLIIPPGRAHPGALVAVTIRQDNLYYGTFWVAFDQPHNFTEAEIRFLTTLSGEVALAAASARLYATAEVGRQRLEAVLDSTPEPVLVIDEQFRLLLLNPAALQTVGLVNSTGAGYPIQEVVAVPELVNLLVGPLEGRLTTREICLGNNRIYYVTVAPVSAEGRHVGRICLLRDITHFKELDTLKSDFVATVSHDLRSPLTLMRGYATMLQMVGDLNDQQKGYTKKIIGGVENMTRLVNNLLDLGRIEAGIGLQIEKVQVSQVIDEVINMLQLQATQKEIQLSVDSAAETSVLSIEADRALLQQALANLVENAIKYTPVSGQIRVRIEQRPSTVLFQVIDNGIGIAPLDLPRLFEKFYRSGRREAYTQRGSGLGLAIVKSIAERHKGRVWVDSQLGKGSTFSLELPLRQVDWGAK